ncbi:MAG: CinA family nicotinamide mononucleotide deamidase-related protein, partial [Vicingaceae bacterium]
MVAEIITIGDEILIGQTIDTNSAWMAKQLNAIGVDVGQITSIRDARPNILESLDEATKRADIIIMTGGLGPTRDDITKKVLCEYFDTELVQDPEVLARIENYFKSRGREVLESNRQQADLPKACTILDNFVGTASGMWFEKEGKVFISMPGVPYEMKHLLENQVLPRLKKKFKFPHIFHHTIMTEGIGESFLAELVKHWEDSLTEEGIKIAYLPSPGVVKVRLTVFGDDLKEIQAKVLRKAKEFESLVPNYVFGQNDQSAEEAIATLLKNSGKTVVTAESCTGGYLAHLLTATAGSSQYFLGSVIAYSNAV